MYGFRGQATTGEYINRKGYKTHSSMRRGVKKFLSARGIILTRWYEFRIASDGFHLVAKSNWELTPNDLSGAIDN